jgi:hypothetical protein
MRIHVGIQKLGWESLTKGANCGKVNTDWDGEQIGDLVGAAEQHVDEDTICSLELLQQTLSVRLRQFCRRSEHAKPLNR